jgi:hypothetical protein
MEETNDIQEITEIKELENCKKPNNLADKHHHKPHTVKNHSTT